MTAAPALASPRKPLGQFEAQNKAIGGTKPGTLTELERALPMTAKQFGLT
ncbi:MAG: hypothetical protein QOE23_1693 [Pseudonocardiales bacterium]|jgi:hypothetical protein|nr:hypothetical protein [Pseudonocardiales bacterium]